MSIGSELVKSLKEFVTSLKEGRPLRVTKITKTEDGFHVVRGHTKGDGKPAEITSVKDVPND